MASRFRRNRAPGWASSDEDGEISSGEVDSDEDITNGKRFRSNEQSPDLVSKMQTNQATCFVRKVNNIWGDALADQQLSGGLVAGIRVAASETTVPRGSETYDCRKMQQETATDGGDKDSKMDDDVKPKEPATTEKPVESVFEPFNVGYAEGPDMMSDVAPKTRGGGGDRKRPWPRGGAKHWTKNSGDHGDTGSDSSQHGSHESTRGRGRGRGRGHDRGRGRGRGRGFHNGGYRSLGPLEKATLSEDSPINDIGLAIAKSLREPKTELITRAVQTIGASKAIELYNQTIDIEGAGGKMTLNGSRRRTPGGVFLYLIREDPSIAESQKEEIFGVEKEEHRQQLQARRRQYAERQKQLETPMDSDVKPLKDAKEDFLGDRATSAMGDLSSDDVKSEPDEMAVDG